jgi:hypothetical protein
MKRDRKISVNIFKKDVVVSAILLYINTKTNKYCIGVKKTLKMVEYWLFFFMLFKRLFVQS